MIDNNQGEYKSHDSAEDGAYRTNAKKLASWTMERLVVRQDVYGG